MSAIFLAAAALLVVIWAAEVVWFVWGYYRKNKE